MLFIHEAFNYLLGCLPSPPLSLLPPLFLSGVLCLISGGGDFKSPEQFKLCLPQRTNYLYGRITKSLPEMYAFTLCMWIKSTASPGIGTPFSYGVPGQANEIVLIEWGNNPIELLINDKASSFRSRSQALLFDCSLHFKNMREVHFKKNVLILILLTTGCPVAFGGARWKVAPHLHLLDHTGRPMGRVPRRWEEGEWR